MAGATTTRALFVSTNVVFRTTKRRNNGSNGLLACAESLGRAQRDFFGTFVNLVQTNEVGGLLLKERQSAETFNLFRRTAFLLSKAETREAGRGDAETRSPPEGALRSTFQVNSQLERRRSKRLLLTVSFPD